MGGVGPVRLFGSLAIFLFFLSACGGGSGGGASPSEPPSSGTDTTPPTITLVGEAEVVLVEGEPYEELGASAQDGVDGSVTVSIEGEVGSELGTYVVTYSASDRSGNTASTTRTVIVEEAYPGLRLFWNEEFLGSQIDTDLWSYDLGTGSNGWGNNEFQYYQRENASLIDGKLVIEAKRESFGGRDYTSSRLKTQGSFDFRYGRLDVRAKLPEGQGIWPAIWMLGSSFTQIGWPFSGEIDVMEMIGGSDREDTVYGTAHWNQGGVEQPYQPVMFGGSYSLSNGETFSDDFHTFSVQWDADEIAWFVDDVRFHVMSLDDSDNLAAFREKFFIILNVAVGGNWPGAPDDSTQFPQRMEIDFLRLYQDPNNEAPQVTLIGADSVSVVLGSESQDPGATADDREDGDLSANIVSDWDTVVQTDTPGTYTVTYQVTDSDGESSVAQRIVTVQESTLAKLIVGRWQLDGDGAASVGPSPGSDQWWSSKDEGNNSGPFNRPCWFDDVYEFTASGDFLNDHGADTFLEPWQGTDFACGDPVAPHDGSISATYQIDESAQTITLTGRGAYVGLPKAVNGSELSSPDDAPESVTYKIDELDDNRLVVYVESGNNVFWTFRLKPWSENAPEQVVDVFEGWTVPTLGGAESPTAYVGYDLLFADEFDGTELDEAKWKFDIGTGSSGWGNNESQFYTDRNVKVQDGVLTIRARSEDLAGRSYTSSRIKSQGLFDFQYGRVDVRAALPKGQGLWPAIWMLGANFTEVGWPMSGEIDIMELVGNNDQRVYGTAHWNNGGVSAPYSPAMYGGSFDLDSGSFFEQYHVFSLVWTANKLTWLVDDEVYHEMALDDSANLAPFRESFFLIMNVAVGGNWPGYPDPADDDVVFPQEMIVDYIRIFQPID